MNKQAFWVLHREPHLLMPCKLLSSDAAAVAHLSTWVFQLPPCPPRESSSLHTARGSIALRSYPGLQREGVWHYLPTALKTLQRNGSF